MILFFVKLKSVMQLRPLKQNWTSAGQECMKSETVMAMDINKLGSVLQLHKICFADTKVERNILPLFS